MANRFLLADNVTPSTNLTPTIHAATNNNLFGMLLAVGWVTDGSGAGTSGGTGTFGVDGVNRLTTTATWDNPKCWWTGHSPDNKIYLCIQRDASGVGGAGNANGAQMRIKSATSTFNQTPTGSGTLGLGVTPSSLTEQIIIGSGTDAAPGFTTLLINNNGALRQNIMVQSASPYGFWCATWATTRSNAFDGMFFYDPLSSGGYDSADAAPFVVAAYCTSSGNAWAALGAYSQAWKSILNGASRVWRNAALQMTADSANQRIYPGTSMVNPESSQDNQIYPMWGRNPAQAVPLWPGGQSSLFRFNSYQRAFGDILSVNGGTRNAFQIVDLVLDWDGTASVTV